MDNQFYPTPPSLAARMVGMIKNTGAGYVLDPSAGRGDLLKTAKRMLNHPRLMGIEIDPTLAASLSAEDLKAQLIGVDFLDYSGGDRVDVFLMNPPFNDAASHLMHALDLAYNAEIVCLLNAETIRNQFSRERVELGKRLEKLGASVEFIQGAFQSAERPTGVEIALVYIDLRRDEFEDFTAGMGEAQADEFEAFQDSTDIAPPDQADEMRGMVSDYEAAKRQAVEVLRAYYSAPLIHNVCFVAIGSKGSHYNNAPTTAHGRTMAYHTHAHEVVRELRRAFWKKATTLEGVRRYTTADVEKELDAQIERFSVMDFNAGNILALMQALSVSFSANIEAAINKVFDLMTLEHAYNDDSRRICENIWMYNGWKTNDAFAIGRKVILPLYATEAGWRGGLQLKWNGRGSEKLSDIETVLSYFSNGRATKTDIIERTAAALAVGETKVAGEFFTLTLFKKGTAHFTFNEEQAKAVRRLNIWIGKRRQWLPPAYGDVPFYELDDAGMDAAVSFDGGADAYDDRRARGENISLISSGRVKGIGYGG